ncbi:hypothetical protein SprV_0902664200 [Sparganum proliferum]
MVYLQAVLPRIPSDSVHRPLQQPYGGPLRVLSRVGPGDLTEVVSIDRLKVTFSDPLSPILTGQLFMPAAAQPAISPPPLMPAHSPTPLPFPSPQLHPLRAVTVLFVTLITTASYIAPYIFIFLPRPKLVL